LRSAAPQRACAAATAWRAEKAHAVERQKKRAAPPEGEARGTLSPSAAAGAPVSLKPEAPAFACCAQSARKCRRRPENSNAAGEEE